MNALAAVLAAFLAAGAEAPSTVAAVSGYGGMAAGLDASGGLIALHWPGPGGPNQIRASHSESETGDPVTGTWSIELDGTSRRAGESEASVKQQYALTEKGKIITTSEWPDGVIARQISEVHSDRDVFITAIEVRGAFARPRLTWRAEFAPATRHVPELAEAGDALDATRGFAAFSDPATGRIWFFRPEGASATDWARAREFVRDGASVEAWSDFDDGVWIGIGAAGASNVQVAPVGVAGEASEAVLTATAGRSTATIEPTVEERDGVYRAWVAIGIGETFAAVTGLLDVTDKLPWSLQHESPRVSPGDTEAAQQLILLEYLRVLSSTHDVRTRYTVRGLGSTPPLARNWPRDGALVAWMYFEIGERDEGRLSVEAYLDLIRTQEKPRRPIGSMPESVYTSGELASPHFVIDDRGPARVLWVADRFARGLKDVDRRGWVQRHWEAIEAATGFLCAWSDPRRGAPLYSADPVGLADGVTQDRLFAAYAGISAGIRLAEHAGEMVPEPWRNRQDRLRELIEWVIAEPGRWVPGASLLLDTDGIAPESLDRLHRACIQPIHGELDREAKARLLLQRAILGRSGRNDAGLQDEIRAFADNAGAVPDSLIAAEIILATLLHETS